MTILLDLVPADASRATPRVEETPAPKLWANQARIVDVEFRAYCDWFVCNSHKGPNIAGRDPNGGALTALFNPRTDVWADHFRWEGAAIVGTSAVGRTTVGVLNMDDPLQLVVRQTLIDEGAWDG